ncbi:MAG: hypothetical protein WC378_08595 [Opitutaceae bacterium]|jgi:hypothetical protein
MNQPNDDQKQPDNMDKLKQQASACGPGCGCNAPGTSKKTCWLIGAIVLVAAGVLVVRAVIKNNRASAQAPVPAFSAPPSAQAPVPIPAVQQPSTAATTAALESGPALGSNVPTKAEMTSVCMTIGAFSELNTAVGSSGAVFIFVPGKEGVSASAPMPVMQSAARTIESRAGLKCSLLSLKADSPDYAKVAAQVPLPGILAMVKGRGMSVITGDITEEKLIQGFVAASSAGGCGTGGGGCGPATAGCK